MCPEGLVRIQGRLELSLSKIRIFLLLDTDIENQQFSKEVGVAVLLG